MKFKQIVLIFLVAFNLRLGISSMPPVLTMIQQSFQLTNLQSSLLTSIPVICMGVLAFFVSKIQQSVGREKGIFLFLLLLGGSLLSRGFLVNYSGLLLSALFIGFAIAVIGPLLSGYIKQSFPNQSGLLIGIYSLSMGLGSVSASSVMLPLTRLLDNKWYYALGSWGILAIISAVIWYSMQKDKKKSSVKENPILLKDVIKERSVWKMIVFFGIQSGMFYGLVTWINSALIERGLSVTFSVGLLTLFTAVQMISSFIIPAMMDRIGRIDYWIMSCCILMLAASGLFLFTTTRISAGIAILCSAVAAGGFFPIAMLLPIQNSRTAAEASTYTSFVQAFGYIAGGAAPILIGGLIDLSHNHKSLYITMIVGAAVLFLIGMSEGRRKDEQPS
ncbi:MFS transporter [Enterococcus florum]|uniref:MFS transporter n=1 Tax=Enterococcus florum TaxID=2480627 RepID=A0A4P5PJE0_9ENTE|nr:MFS transporter [Enterococcus florum]GCF93453.1 MFS transporter [Enterococcus florum]